MIPDPDPSTREHLEFIAVATAFTLSGGCQNRQRKGMLTMNLCPCSQLQDHAVVIFRRYWNHALYGGAAFRQGTCLIKADRVELGHRLEMSAAFYQNAAACAVADRCADSSRCRQTGGAWAS